LRTSGFTEFSRTHWSTEIASHSTAFSAAQGASTGTSVAIWSIRVISMAASGRISGSGGTVPV
jgi:hypothetical protein